MIGVYPIKKSNKPPYIYWKALVIGGIILLILSLFVASLSTFSIYQPIYQENKKLELTYTPVKIPSNTQKELLTPKNNYKYITNLSLIISTKKESCNTQSYLIIIGLASNMTLSCNKLTLLTIQGIAAFKIVPESLKENNLIINYNYTILRVYCPYSSLAYLSFFLSLIGAGSSALGVLLFTKKKILEKLEKSYSL